MYFEGKGVLFGHEDVLETWRYTRVYPKVSGLADWSENCK
jgi:hypothetical protein